VAKVFICYRRDDSAGHAGRVHDRLVRELGRDLFMDVDAIPLGADFTKILREEVAKCDVLLALIGPNWLNVRNEQGNRRLEDSDDFVRIEIATALQRNIPVIPILLDGARIPKADQLPNDLEELTRRNGLEVRHASFHSDVDKLIRRLKSPSAQVNSLAAQKFPVEERLPREPLEAKARGTGSELISASAGIVAGTFTAWFVGWGPGIVAAQVFRPMTIDQEELTSVVLPVFIVALGLALLYWRKDFLDMRGWISFGMVSCITCLFWIWCSVIYSLTPLIRGSMPTHLWYENPGFVFGGSVYGASLLWLLISRLRRRRKRSR
jgi:hypothetical protein